MPIFACFHRLSDGADKREMPPAFVPQFNCDRKFLFLDESDAARELRRLQRKAVHPWRLNAYFCYRHQGWHVGNKPLW